MVESESEKWLAINLLCIGTPLAASYLLTLTKSVIVILYDADSAVFWKAELCESFDKVSQRATVAVNLLWRLLSNEGLRLEPLSYVQEQ